MQLISILNSQVSLVSLVLYFLIHQVSAQETVIRGRVTDAGTGDPIPFANVYFKATNIGANTDFDGYYFIRTNNRADSLIASFVGYQSRTKAVTSGITQTINFQLEEEVVRLKEVVFLAGENPAFGILREVIRNKSKNDKRSLDAYQYETYTKIEIDVDNISDELRQRKFMQKISQVLDSIDVIAGEDGKPILPLFISESLSEFYFRSNPKLRHEKIVKTRLNGIGVEDGTLVSQVIGSSFQEYNFYQNWLNILDKDFASPIADGWRLYYDYDLTDSLYVGEDFCYRLDFFPRNSQDLAFIGTMWITKTDFALKQIEVQATKSANINFVEKIRIQQELTPTVAGAWLPLKTRVLVNVGELSSKQAGMLAKFYTSNKNIEVNQPLPHKFYQQPISLKEDYQLNNGEDFWIKHRHELLRDTELSVYKMIDTLRNIPVVRNYVELLKILTSGEKRVGDFWVGPYMSLYAWNTYEGHRFQLGTKTAISFSDKWELGGRVAYGTEDNEFKYRAFVRNIISRSNWTEAGYSRTKDVQRLGISEDDLVDNSIFLAATRYGNFRRPFTYNEDRLYFQRELFKGFRQTVSFKYSTFDPEYNFAYYKDPLSADATLASRFQTAELSIEARYARDEFIVVNDNARISLGTLRWPIITMKYTRGIKGVWGSDFDYNKVALNVKKNVRMGPLGYSAVSFSAEHIFETLPNPLLRNHVGNETFFFTTGAYNLMNFNEFTSSSFTSLKVDHHFETFLFNRLPLLGKLKWRPVATANILYGGMSEANKALNPETFPDGTPIAPVGFLDNRPYVELGYGLENILKVLRVDAIHRLSYLDRPHVNRFGLKISLQFIL